MARGWTVLLLALMALGAAAALVAGFALAAEPDGEGIEVGASASGEMLAVTGADPFGLTQAKPTTGTVEVKAVEAGGRWSALQSKDTMDATAEFVHPTDGATYRVELNKPMRQEPLGRYTTWFGVSLGHAHHGDTGIDTPALPRLASELALWGYADVYRNGQLIAGEKPAHFMVVRKEQGSLPGQVFLSVATDAKDLVGAPDGYLSVAWKQVGALSTTATQGIDRHTQREAHGNLRPAGLGELLLYGRREIVGYGGLLFVVAGLLLLVGRPWPGRRDAPSAG